jgi:hypothetical protein
LFDPRRGTAHGKVRPQTASARQEVTMNTSKLWAGASGYAFKEWKGSFYPEKIQPEAMLAWYAERLPAVEINNTFIDAQGGGVKPISGSAPEASLAIKASRRITHDAASRPTRRPTPPPTSTRTWRRSAPSAGRCSFSCRRFSRRTCPA